MTPFKPKEIPEGINTSKTHPLKDFVILIFGVLALIGCTYIVLGIGSDYLANKISYKKEVELFRSTYIKKVAKLSKGKASNSTVHQKNQKRLSILADALWAPFDQSVQIDSHIMQDKLSNAFMTPGGVMFATSAIMDLLKNENELAFVVCHELGHFYHHHVLRSLGRTLSLTFIGSLIGAQDGAEFLGTGLQLAQLSFSRSAEQEADEFALDCMHNKYGNVKGFDRFFIEIQKDKLNLTDSQVFKYIRTHPVTSDRLEHLKEVADKRNYPYQ